MGVVEEDGDDVKNVKVGDFVVGSFVMSDNTCEICQAGFQPKCVHAMFATPVGTQAEKACIPPADGTLVATPATRPLAVPRPARRLRRTRHRLVRPRRGAGKAR
ncbi:hypothetical protein STENM36S_04930 [Streptomyces tendae]